MKSIGRKLAWLGNQFLKAELTIPSDNVAMCSTVNIIFERVGKVDPVTRGIEMAVNYLEKHFSMPERAANPGMYFVSSMLLMGMNMPLEYGTIITEVLGELQFNFYHRWFDVIFLVSALSNIGFYWHASDTIN
ncbi:hypothetical protein DPMN_058175 [Dreissena polymorpha]|uniref:Abscisic acid G-protein coupled receptor-like domain-containing protein n=1 Tax=Dreissena polymorpha TaxID=45954 RepID=A0A9D4C1I5_DREPO|nr:hypothetical protein DPMN_058175 [Dreissena polymorpha]